jgi:hypothetical protein
LGMESGVLPRWSLIATSDVPRNCRRPGKPATPDG